MSTDASRRKKPPKRYTVVVVPGGEGGKTRSVDLGRFKILLIVLATVLGLGGLTIALLVYTPLAYVISIPNPRLEHQYGTQLVRMQAQLQSLAEEVILMRDYSVQLRKVLGEESRPDSVRRRDAAPSVMIAQHGPADTLMETTVALEETMLTEDYDLEADSYYDAIVTQGEGFRAAFPLLQPAEGFVTRGFEPAKKHFGIDCATTRGSAVYAATDGYVVFAGWTYEHGNMLIVSHGGGYLTVYKHNQGLLKGEQEFVRRGDVVALVGDTGRTSGGPHLHFEVWKDGVPLDPKEFLLTSPRIQ